MKPKYSILDRKMGNPPHSSKKHSVIWSSPSFSLAYAMNVFCNILALSNGVTKNVSREISPPLCGRRLRGGGTTFLCSTSTLTLPLKMLCRKSVHGSTGSPRTDHGTLEINPLPVRPELVEGRTANDDTAPFQRSGPGERAKVKCLTTRRYGT